MLQAFDLPRLCAATYPLHLFIMICCANNPSCSPFDGTRLRHKRPSAVVSYVAFSGSVIFTLAAAAALVTSDLPLPLF